MASENAAGGHALRLGHLNEIFAECRGDSRPGHQEGLAGRGQHNGRRRHDQPLGGPQHGIPTDRTARRQSAEGWQPAEFNGEHRDEEQARPKGRHGIDEEDAGEESGLPGPPAVPGGDRTERGTGHQADHGGRKEQEERPAGPLRQQTRDRPPVADRSPEITRSQVTQEAAVLHDDRGVQSELLPHGCALRERECGDIVAEQVIEWVARGQAR